MALPLDNVSMAVFCDFENVALGVRDAKYEKFDIKPVLERLLLKGSIVVKKAYCDWDRYKGFKASMHEASFELIEIPHVRQSGKNSADIRLVVDALDLCYTKSHVDTFVIISGDSDFSPLVSKLRENAKKVIGVGVKKSTSDLLVANCDEFIFYDDLVREQQRALAKREQQQRAGNGGAKRPDEPSSRKHDLDARKAEAIALAVETFDALASERDDVGKIWASVLKSAIKRRKPDFNESYYGFRAFGNLLDEAQARGLLEVGRDDKSGAFVSRARQPAAVEHVAPAGDGGAHHGTRAAEPARAGRHAQRREQRAEAVVHESVQVDAETVEMADVADVEPVAPAETIEVAEASQATEARGEANDGRKRARKSAAKKTGTKKGAAAKSAGGAKHGADKHAHGKHADDTHRDAERGDAPHVDVTHAGTAAAERGGEIAAAQPSHDTAPVEAHAEAAAEVPAAAKKKPARKAAPRARRPRKTAAAAE
ncbi:NYN domain-containing protein [Burkholderia sp. BCC1999]|uniref:NYN domain-containing protein n=1 Tax=Burkholderia sp. BCC1999 TaxID=2817448 RepID=UPI002AC34D67|nr:NYN domain-containing protein [Burkholderia sp. BCC1999]